MPDTVIIPQPSRFFFLKQKTTDSLARQAIPEIIPYNRSLGNQHIDNPAVRYSLENLEQSPPTDNYELARAIRTVMEYMESANTQRVLEQARRITHTQPQKEDALSRIKAYLERTESALPLEGGRVVTENDTLDRLWLNQQDLMTLLLYMENDPNYQWMREVMCDSVQLTMLTTNNDPKQIWINTGRSDQHRFTTENMVGDTVNAWVEVLPENNAIKFYLSDNMVQTRRTRPRRDRNQVLELSYPTGTDYSGLLPMTLPEIRRNYWTYYTDVTFSFGQGYISDNWSSGGNSYYSLRSVLQYFLNYKRNSLTWENSFKYRVGAIKNGSDKLSKNEDKLEITSKLGHKAFKHWNYAAQFDMNTQLFTSYNNAQRETIIGNFLSPGYFTLSVGFDYKPKNTISLYLSPIAGKWTVVRDTVKVNPTRYGIEKGKKVKSSAGAKLELNTKHTKVFKLFGFDQKLVLFASYYDDPPTAEWQANIKFDINHFMKTSIYMNAKYDKNNSKKIQFKETLTLDVYFRF